jgi:Bacterial PH domain
VKAHHEHEFEAAPGLPEPLPKGERLIWQGSPDAVQLAIHAFHVRKLAIYFGAMLVLQWLYLLGEPNAALLQPLLTSAVMASLALLLLGVTAWFAARTTLYTLTDRRIVMRIGVVLTLTLNLPLKQIASAAFKPQAGGHGDIALSLAGKDRIAYLNLWPHARAWQLKNPQPSLRCLPGAAAVGERVQQAWLAANPQAAALVGMPAPASASAPTPSPMAAPVSRPVREHGMPSAA